MKYSGEFYLLRGYGTPVHSLNMYILVPQCDTSFFFFKKAQVKYVFYSTEICVH